MSFFTLKTITLVLITLVIIYFNFFVILTLLVYKIYYTLNYTVVLLIISVRSLLTASQLLHLLIIYALLLVTFSLNTIVTSWDLQLNSHTSYYNFYYRSFFRNNTFVDNTYIFNTLTQNNNYSNINTNSFYWFNNNLDSQFFELSLNSNFVKQIIYNHTYMYTFSVSIKDNSSFLPEIFFTILYITFLRAYFFKLKIIL